MLFLAHASVASAQSDLQITSSASRTSGLWLDDAVVLTTTIRNNGPGPSALGMVSYVGEVEEFAFGLPSTDTPGCDLDTVEFEPPRLNFMWPHRSLAAGEAFTCVLRLGVFNVPTDGTARLTAYIDPVDDSVVANNRVVFDFAFGTSVAATPRAIPATSHAGALLGAIGILAAAFIALAKARRQCAARFVAVLALPLADHSFAANPLLFTEILDASANPPPRVLAKYPVTVNVAALDSNPDAISVVLPGSEQLAYTAMRVRFEARPGGGYHWIGNTGDYDVVLTVDGQLVTGFIRGGGETYAIKSWRELGVVDHSLNRVDAAALPPDIVEGDEVLLNESTDVGLKGNVSDFPQAQCFGAPNEPIDILVAYSPEALALTGGDVALLRNQLANAEAKANTTLANSNIAARVHIVAVEPTPASLVEIGKKDDLANARDNAELQLRRRQHHADVVVYLVSEGTSDGTQYCGLTRAQRRAGKYFYGMGYDFYESAVLVLVHECMVLENDLSHEVGHIVGLDHNPIVGGLGNQDTNIFPFAFGHFVNFFFRDDMSGSGACSNGCPRKLFFSDPTMSYGGYPRGTKYRNNAETYRRMYHCTNTLADFIFVDNFE